MRPTRILIQVPHLVTRLSDHRFSDLNIAICAPTVLVRSRRLPISPESAAFIVDIAAIDSKSKVLLTNAQITSLAGQLSDYTANMAPGLLRNNWQSILDTNTTLPRPAISGIRLYERSFYLSPPIL